MTETAVLTEDLTKFYGGRRGVEGLSLEVRPGEVMGFLGPNGAGKTTTIRLLLDYLRPTRGTARVLGLDPACDRAAVHRRTGYLPGDLRLPDRERARDVVGYATGMRGVARGEAEAVAERLELDTSLRVRALSKGNRQKLGLVLAFLHRPDLLVLDEPTSGLDPLVQQEFHTMVREATDRGATVLMSSHVLTEVQQSADRVAIVRAGRLVAVERMESLGRRAVRTVEVHFGGPVDAAAFAALPGVGEVRLEGAVLRCTVDGSLDPLVKELARHEVVDLLSHEPDLEETFLSYYDLEGIGDVRPVDDHVA